MSNYNSIIEQNNLDLTSILSTINELPDAGGGTPGVCTIIFDPLYPNYDNLTSGPIYFEHLYYINSAGELDTFSNGGILEGTFNAMCGTPFLIVGLYSDWENFKWENSDGINIHLISYQGVYMYMFTTPNTPGEYFVHVWDEE